MMNILHCVHLHIYNVHIYRYTLHNPRLNTCAARHHFRLQPVELHLQLALRGGCSPQYSYYRNAKNDVLRAAHLNA